jgi:hypothetical protein
MHPPVARRLWHRIELVNAVIYFTAEARDAAVEVGLQGFWMGYFASRAAPLGPVGPGVVEATFYNFHPSRVRRAIPDAWTYATPADVLDARATAAAAALRRLLPDGLAERLAADVSDDLAGAVEVADGAGRPLFAANRDVVAPADPVAALWQLATTLREHRGDGHVALLAAAGLDGCEVHVVLTAATGLDPQLFLFSRGWSEDEWADAVGRLASRGLVRDDGSLTNEGAALHRDIERRTDELAVAPYRALGEAAVERVIGALETPASLLSASGEILFPNPMALPQRPSS